MFAGPSSRGEQLGGLAPPEADSAYSAARFLSRIHRMRGQT